MEGIGFMVIEPAACGLPVITTDYPPMNEFIPQPEMRVAPRWFKRRAYATQWIPHAHLRLPRHRDLVRKIAWCAQHDLAAISRENRRCSERRFDPAALHAAWSRTLAALP
jgi:glycosyltransferase involved in cell wall biosynthesis